MKWALKKGLAVALPAVDWFWEAHDDINQFYDNELSNEVMRALDELQCNLRTTWETVEEEADG